MAGEPVVFDSAIEGLFVRGLAGKVTPQLKQKLRAEGLDLDQKLKAQYPREVWIRVMDVTARELYPGVPAEEAYRRMGDIAVAGIGNTLIGKAIVSMARMLGPKRAMYRLNQAFGSLNNFMKLEVKELTPSHFELFVNDCYGRPTYIEGALGAAVRISHNKPFQVRLLEQAPNGAVKIEIRWTN